MQLVKYENLMQVYRKRQKLSQWELAQLLKVNQKTISDWETGKELPPIDKREQIAGILEKDVETIFP